MNEIANSLRTGPNERGLFGIYGGRFVAETLMPNILALEEAYNKFKDDPKFLSEFDDLAKNYVGRPSPLYFAERTTNELGGAKIYFKRDELNHTGAHKINNCLGQILLAKRMGKTPNHSRNWSRSARSCYSHCLRVVWAPLCCVYGR